MNLSKTRYKREKRSFEMGGGGGEKGMKHRNQGRINGKRKEWEVDKVVSLSKCKNYEGLYYFKG